jgi:LysR family transcriptional regulator, regulator for bpeEF and oprC
MSITIQAMTIFVRAVDANGFTAAARSLLIDPTAVGRAIKGLEVDLGVLLFARSTRMLRLTAEGGRFYRDCVQLLTKYGEVTQRFRADRTTPRGRLRVGMAPAITRRMLLGELPAFQQKYPDIEIILLGIDEEIEIGDKGIDVLLRGRSLRQRGGRHPERQGLVVRKLFQSRFVVCASPEYLERAGVPRQPMDLSRHACAVFLTMERDIQDEWQFVRGQARQRVKVSPKLFAQGHDALREAGVAGCGIIRTGVCHVEDELRARKLVRVLADWECPGIQPYVAIYRKTQPQLPQVNVFVRHMADALRKYNSI